MSLYRALLIDIIYSLRKDNLDNEAESKQLDMDRQNLASNYGIAQSLIDIMFENLKDQPITFNPNLRLRQDFFYAKEQISTLDATIELDGFNPAITKEERLQIEDPKIRRIILEQELVPQNADPEQSILFIHLMFLSFPELSQNNSIMVKRKYVLLKLFEQQPYSYQCQEQVYQFGKKPGTEDHTHNGQNLAGPNDQRMTSQCIQEQSTQDLSIRSDQGMNQQCSQFYKLKQIDSKAEIQLGDLRQLSQIHQILFCFDSNYPIEIEQLSSHTFKMTFSNNKQFVYRWSQLDPLSYFDLRTTHPEAFHCWESMLKLLNGNQFQAFINNQLEDSESNDEKATNPTQLDQQLMDNNMQLDHIISVNSMQSIVKFSNKVIILESNELSQTNQTIEQQIEIVNNLIITRNQIKAQIEQIQNKYHINCTLEEWQERQTQLKNRTIWDYALDLSDSLVDQLLQTTTAQEQQIKVVNQIECNHDKVMKSDEAVQTYLFYESLNSQQLQKINKSVEFRFDQSDYADPNSLVQQSNLVNCSFSYVEDQHKGQWIFDRQYPLKIVKLSNLKLSFLMNRNKIIIVEWWQFNYDSLKSLLVEKGAMQPAYFWSIMLILIDEDQFFQLWKGESIEQRPNVNGQVQQSFKKVEFQEGQNIEQTLNISGTDLPETIIQYNYNFIIKFKNYVEIFTQTEFEQFQVRMQSQDTQPNNWQIQNKKVFYTRKMNIFEERFLTEQKNKSRQTTPHSHNQHSITELSQNKLIQGLSTSTKGLYFFYDDYPIRIDVIEKDSLSLQFKKKKKNATIEWQQFDYNSLIKLIDQKINITAGETWSNMLILIDHDQFYKLWKGYHHQQEKDEIENKSNEQLRDQPQQEQIESNKRDPPDEIPQMIVKVDNLKSIVSFRNFVEIQTNEQVAKLDPTLEITWPQFSKLKIKYSRAFYNQNIKAFKQRLNLEKIQGEKLNTPS